jgi:dTDP-4-dehydrorhamnose reductase
MERLELWGGVECSMNRTGDAYHDQTRLNGHHQREQDLDLVSDLGIAALRFPVLWERIAPDAAAAQDWEWTDRRLRRLRALEIRPIAGLVHHGSGPRYADLLDRSFAPGLAAFAGQVAQRYPWIVDWTPINEPVTTARFAALYGHWYPHLQDERSFWLALLNQVDATRLSMQAVRRVNAAARLIQTDDLGRTYSTIELGEQAGFDNLRRWAGWDLLCGRVVRQHPLWDRLSSFGLSDRLWQIADDPCQPDIIGINHYLTSDRFLDHRLQRYPVRTHGGNERARYADTEAIRVLEPPPAGLAGALREAYERYRLPLAITEVHNGCTREEQLRWAAEAWDTAIALRGDGVDLRAVTAWSLLGSQGWNTLLTAHGLYEPGVFDVSTGAPRPTALATLWKGLPTGAARHPVAAETGWWARRERLTHEPVLRPAGVARARHLGRKPVLLILGATGTLGQAFARACATRGIHHILAGRPVLDLERPDSAGSALDRVRPWAVVNAAGWVRVEDAEREEAACRRVNATGAVALAQACGARDIGYLGFSSDLVFDGLGSRAYVESDQPTPVSAYGRSKAAMEAGCASVPHALVVRTAAFFSSRDPFNFAAAVRETLAAGRPFAAASDEVVTPTYVPHLVEAALDLLIDGEVGLWHLTNGEALSWAEFAKRIAAACDLDDRWIEAVPGAFARSLVRQPISTALASERGIPVGVLDAAIQLFATECKFGDARQDV